MLPYYVVHAWPVLHPDPYRGSAAEAVDLLRTLPDGALAISDEPGLVWRAGRRTPPDLVDASVLRIQTGDLTSESVADGAAEPDVCAVVVRSGERWGSFDDLPDRLADAGYEVAAEDGDGPPRLPQARLPPPDAPHRARTLETAGGGRGGRGGGGPGWRRSPW